MIRRIAKMKDVPQAEKLKFLLTNVYQKANGGASFEDIMELMKSELHNFQMIDK